MWDITNAVPLSHCCVSTLLLHLNAIITHLLPLCLISIVVLIHEHCALFPLLRSITIAVPQCHYSAPFLSLCCIEIVVRHRHLSSWKPFLWGVTILFVRFRCCGRLYYTTYIYISLFWIDVNPPGLPQYSWHLRLSMGGSRKRSIASELTALAKAWRRLQ